jgi:hypothetical protein
MAAKLSELGMPAEAAVLKKLSENQDVLEDFDDEYEDDDFDDDESPQPIDPNNRNQLAAALSGAAYWYDSKCSTPDCREAPMNVFFTHPCYEPINGVTFLGEDYALSELPILAFSHCPRCSLIHGICFQPS